MREGVDTRHRERKRVRGWASGIPSLVKVEGRVFRKPTLISRRRRRDDEQGRKVASDRRGLQARLLQPSNELGNVEPYGRIDVAIHGPESASRSPFMWHPGSSSLVLGFQDREMKSRILITKDGEADLGEALLLTLTFLLHNAGEEAKGLGSSSLVPEDR